jgi:hypothetical protein
VLTSTNSYLLVVSCKKKKKESFTTNKTDFPCSTKIHWSIPGSQPKHTRASTTPLTPTTLSTKKLEATLLSHEVDQTMRPWNDKCPQLRINLSNSKNLSSIIWSELLLLSSLSYPISRAYNTHS